MNRRESEVLEAERKKAAAKRFVKMVLERSVSDGN